VSEQQHEPVAERDADEPGGDTPGEGTAAVDKAGAAGADPDLSAVAERPVEHTGNPVVDSVLDSLRELDALPPSEHVAVFEAAHERLRGALADAGEPPADS
jgi:hypothetical protein